MRAWKDQREGIHDSDPPRSTERIPYVTGPAPAEGAAPDAILALDPELHVTYWSDAAERLYGIKSGEALGRRFTDLVACHPSLPRHPKEGPRPLEAAGLMNGPAVHVVGGRRSVPVTVSLVSSRRTPRPGDYLVVVRDDAEHQFLTRSLRERLDFEMLISEMSARLSAVSEEEVDGEIRSWLRRLVEMLCVDRGTFAELSPAGGLTVTHSYAVPGVEAYPPGPANQALPWLTKELSAGRAVVLGRIPEDLPQHAEEELRYMKAGGITAAIGVPVSIGGSLVCVLVFCAIRQWHRWSPEVVSRLHLVGEVFANASARRQAKRRLEQKQQELNHVGRVADMGKLAAVIAHELDQPLTAVVTNAQAVRNMLQAPHPDLVEADDALSDVIDAAMRVSEIVQRERRLLRKSKGSFETVDLNDALREVEVFLRAEARQCGANVALELLPGLPSVSADRVQLQQVALNLARNGLQAVRQQPAADRDVTIRTASGIGEVVLTVTDSGPPVDEALLQRMFEPFYTTKPNGLGIGLSICKSIVDGHHGRVWPTRNPGGGLTMHVSIPRE